MHFSDKLNLIIYIDVKVYTLENSNNTLMQSESDTSC